MYSLAPMYLFVEEAGEVIIIEVIIIMRNVIVTFCSRKQIIRQTIHTLSKEWYVVSKEPCVVSTIKRALCAVKRAMHETST